MGHDGRLALHMRLGDGQGGAEHDRVGRDEGANSRPDAHVQLPRCTTGRPWHWGQWVAGRLLWRNL